MLLEFIDDVDPGISRYRLDLGELYPDSDARARFEARWEEFSRSAADHRDLFSRDAEAIVYRTESFLPREHDGRPPVLLVLGNPASHSVRAGMCFAFEQGHTSEHRFWRALAAANWLSFHDAAVRLHDSVEARNARRRAALLAGRYESPFLVGIDIFFTFPSPASAPAWAEVGGLVKLFGRHAMRLIADAERTRLAAPDALGRTNYASVILAAVPTENPRRSARRSRYRRIGQGTFDLAPWEAPGRTAKLHKVAPSIPGWFRNGLRRSAGC